MATENSPDSTVHSPAAGTTDDEAADDRRGRPSAARRATDRRVLAVVDRMSDAFLSFDAEWRVELANREAARLNGCTPEELVGANHWERWPETVDSEVERQYRRAVAERVPVQFEHHYERAGVWHDIRAYPSDHGGLAVFYRDITRQKALEAERARQAREIRDAYDLAFAAETQFRLLVDRVQDYAVFLMGPDGVITHWGLGAARMKGYTAEEVVGRHLSQLYPPAHESGDGTADEHLRDAAAKGEYIGEGWRRRKNGELFPARVVLTALYRDGELVGFSKIAYDLTLERRRAAAVADAMAAAQAANLAKSQFLANTSHEIRTPLNAVIGYSELLELGMGGPLTGQQRSYLERIQATSRHLLALINDVLDLSRIEAGAMRADAAPVLLRDAVHAALLLVEPQAGARDITVHDGCNLEPHATALGDGERVRQILVNLLSNAVRFTDEGGRVEVSCRRGQTPPRGAAVRPSPAWVAISVRDTGPGIAPEQLDRIWEAFVQGDASHTRRVGGSGLGLTISRHLARLMGGDIEVASEPGRGATFTLWLPAPDPEARRGAATGGPPSGDAGADSPAPEDAGAAGAEALLLDEPVTGGALHALGEVMLARCDQVVDRFVARLRADPRMPRTVDMSATMLANHLSTFLADLAHCLVGAGDDGPEALPTLRDGTAIQEVIARRHGEQRARLGWSDAELAVEFAVLRDLVLEVVAEWGATDATSERAGALLASLVERAGAQSRAALRRAQVRHGGGGAPPAAGGGGDAS